MKNKKGKKERKCELVVGSTHLPRFTSPRPVHKLGGRVFSPTTKWDTGSTPNIPRSCRARMHMHSQPFPFPCISQTT